MSGAGHTPGPWYVQAAFGSIYALSDGDVGLAAYIGKVESHQTGEAQAEANARLIAAAPELLEALREAEARHGATASWGDQARAAIAKATGQ